MVKRFLPSVKLLDSLQCLYIGCQWTCGWLISCLVLCVCLSSCLIMLRFSVLLTSGCQWTCGWLINCLVLCVCLSSCLIMLRFSVLLTSRMHTECDIHLSLLDLIILIVLVKSISYRTLHYEISSSCLLRPSFVAQYFILKCLHLASPYRIPY
jgi:hypothetical protein